MDVDLKASPNYKDLLQVVIGTRVVGEMRVSGPTPGSNVVRVKWSRRLIDDPATKGAMASAYLKLLSTYSGAIVSSDMWLSADAVTFWRKLQVPYPVRKFRFASNMGSEAADLAEETVAQIDLPDGAVMTAVLRNYEYRLMIDPGYSIPNAERAFTEELPVHWEWHPPPGALEDLARLDLDYLQGIAPAAKEPRDAAVCAKEGLMRTPKPYTVIRVPLTWALRVALEPIALADRDEVFARWVSDSMDEDPDR